MSFEWAMAGGLVLTCGLVVMACLLAVSAMSGATPPLVNSIFTRPTPATVLLFDGETLIDATPSARTLLSSEGGQGSAWFRALTRLEPLFPGLAARLENLSHEGHFVQPSRSGLEPSVVLRAEYLGGMTRLTLLDSEAEMRVSTTDGAVEIALRDEVSSLRDLLSHAPMMVWRETSNGEVVWANGTYLRAAAALVEPGHELSWPLPTVFGAGDQPSGTRRSLRLPDGPLSWFELSTIPLKDDRLIYAQPIDKLVQSETVLRDFMQTLTKTFANLPVGLAIFDKARVLQLFNPALIDLTGLAPEFLIARPTLPSLLDAMRERAMIPEPKDYRSWRRQLVELEEAAASGLFEDTWTLPSGQTYRVTGRPHPNGALAFMFEDISNEMTRSRRYRADLELGQAVLDEMEDAVVVLAHDGTVTMSNRAATRLWGEAALGNLPLEGAAGAIARWRELTAPTLLWSDLSDFVGTFGPRDPWEGEVRLKDGRLVECRVSAMPHGSTLVAFRLPHQRAAATADLASDQAVMIA